MPKYMKSDTWRQGNLFTPQGNGSLGGRTNLYVSKDLETRNGTDLSMRSKMLYSDEGMSTQSKEKLALVEVIKEIRKVQTIEKKNEGVNHVYN